MDEKKEPNFEIMKKQIIDELNRERMDHSNRIHDMIFVVKKATTMSQLLKAMSQIEKKKKKVDAPHS